MGNINTIHNANTGAKITPLDWEQTRQIIGDRLDVDGPEDVLTDEMLAMLRAHKSELMLLLGAICATCGNPCSSDAGDGWRHTWCSTCRWDRWTHGAGHTLRDAAPLAELFDSARVTIREAIERGDCPQCWQRMNLQSKSAGLWWCSFCREHFTTSDFVN